MKELVALYVGRRGFVLADGFRVTVRCINVKYAYGHVKLEVQQACDCGSATKWINVESVKLEDRS